MCMKQCKQICTISILMHVHTLDYPLCCGGVDEYHNEYTTVIVGLINKACLNLHS